MCPPSQQQAKNIKREEAPTNASSSSSPSSCFTCTRLNPTTFQILEDDKWFEQPIIYAKIFDDVVVLIDTGCGGSARDPGVSLRSLRTFLESFEVPDNNNLPLNGGGPGGRKEYVVVCSHCHFDHIGAIAEFTDSTIWASSNDRAFVSDPERLPTTSLCRFFDMATPQYKVSHWAADGEIVTHKGKDLGLRIYHTPGHTPDELAVFDLNERVLFVGDTLYEQAAIAFPCEGDLREYSRTIGRLKNLVRTWNEDEPGRPGIKTACGHVTSAADGAKILQEVDALLHSVSQGWIQQGPKEEVFREERMVGYRSLDGRYAFFAPKRLFDELKEDREVVAEIARRQL